MDHKWSGECVPFSTPNFYKLFLLLLGSGTQLSQTEKKEDTNEMFAIFWMDNLVGSFKKKPKSATAQLRSPKYP